MRDARRRSASSISLLEERSSVEASASPPSDTKMVWIVRSFFGWCDHEAARQGDHNTRADFFLSRTFFQTSGQAIHAHQRIPNKLPNIKLQRLLATTQARVSTKSRGFQESPLDAVNTIKFPMSISLNNHQAIIQLSDSENSAPSEQHN